MAKIVRAANPARPFAEGRAYDAIFDKFEDAYLAAKKCEASPCRKDCQDTMKRVLEDGIQDANIATQRSRKLTKCKWFQHITERRLAQVAWLF